MELNLPFDILRKLDWKVILHGGWISNHDEVKTHLWEDQLFLLVESLTEKRKDVWEAFAI